MSEIYVNLTRDNLQTEHLCCAIADKKHQCGVDGKRAWLSARIEEGHVFRKLDEKGKVFIEYAPLETAWVPVEGENYLFIYCFWVAGSFKGKGHGKALLNACIDDAKARGKSGVCVISAKKKTPYLTDKKFMQKNGFEAADAIGDYELLALSFDGKKPRFSENAKKMRIDSKKLTIYYSPQCPYIENCISQCKEYCEANQIPIDAIKVDAGGEAKALPCVFNNWALFYNGELVTLHPQNEGSLKKLLAGLV